MKLKKLICAALAVCMTIGGMTAVPASAEKFFAANDDPSMLEDLGIFTDGRLEDYVTRAEFAKVTVMVSPYRDYVATALKTSPYADVPYDHWAANYVKTAVTNGLCSGYPDGTFRPDDYVSFAEAVTMLLRALGYSDEEFGTSWPYGQIGLASNLDITDGVYRDAYDAITRSDVVILLNQTLDTKMKDGSKKLLDDFDIQTTDDVILTATSNEDPAVNSDKIHTTAGNYNINQSFDKSLAGRRGNIAVKDGDTLVSFRASDQTVEEYTVTSVIGGDLILDNSIVGIEKTTPVYYNSEKMTYSTIIPKAKVGDTFKIFKNSIGEIEYGLLARTSASGGEIITNALEEYTVDSIVGNTLLVTSDGKKSQLDLSDSTTAYNDTTETTFSALKQRLSKNDKIYVKYDASGDVDYVWFKGTSGQSVATAGLDEYFIYSVLENGIVTYKDGSFQTINMNSSTTAYVNSQATTFSSAKQQLEMGDVLYLKLDDDGSVDYIIVEEGKLEGPVTVRSSSWYQTVPDFENFTITKNGKNITAEDINIYDIVYYSADLELAIVYSNKVTGIYESASPNMASPNTVTISGKTYDVESTEAFNALSSNGSFSYGDTVTVLLGMDKKIAGVISPDSESGASVTGYVTAAGKKEFTDPNTDDSKVSYYIALTGADGTDNEFETERDMSDYINSVCTVTVNNGTTSVRRHVVNSSTADRGLYGTVSASASKIGNFEVADDVAIMDVGHTDSSAPAAYCQVLLKRIDGVTLNSTNIIYYDKNAAGKVSTLILNNVTGDMYQYGMVTSVKSQGTSQSVKVDVGGTVYSADNYSISRGDGVRCLISGGSIAKLNVINMNSKTVSEITATNVKIGNETFVLSDKVVAYTISENGTYSLSNLNEIKNNQDKYSSIYAYYDKPYANGGRIRILVANER